jgi:hypothetical protein
MALGIAVRIAVYYVVAHLPPSATQWICAKYIYVRQLYCGMNLANGR